MPAAATQAAPESDQAMSSKRQQDVMQQDKDLFSKRPRVAAIKYPVCEEYWVDDKWLDPKLVDESMDKVFGYLDQFSVYKICEKTVQQLEG